MSEKIAVIGAGPMGLAVAYQLVNEGYEPVIFEADDRLGGMTATFNFDGLEIERYYHFHCVSDSAFLTILEELNISNRMRWKQTKMGYWYKNRLQPWGNPIALFKFRGLSMLSKIRYGLHAYVSTKRNNWKPLDKLEASGWIQYWVGKEAWEVLWRRLFEYKFYDYSKGLSAAWIWSRIRRIGRSRFNLFQEKLGYLDGGSDTLLCALEQFISEHGGEFRLKSPVEKVLISENAISGVRVGGEDEYFDKVISTIPLPYIPDMIPELPDNVLKKFSAKKNIAVVCIIVKMKNALSDNFWLNTNDPEMDIPGLVEYSNLQPLENHVVYVPFYMPGDHAMFLESDEYFFCKVRRYLCKINPLLSNEDFIGFHASRYRYAQPICEPGYLDELPPVSLPVSGLFVADTSYYYPEDRGISESIEYGRNMARMVVNNVEHAKKR